ncbi:MAG TPA: murein biosynthesis integral membrane protein MurJ [Anaerolineales bacterium]|nr:murein biosynthesis integral membrane protein MurJ [Anaerolineales bacterium]
MKHVARSSLIIAVFFGIDKVLGFIRQVLIARQFGLSYEIDVFNAANNIPDLLSALISGGALGVALIPVLSEYLDKRGRSDAWDLFSRILNLAFLVTAAISLVIILLADPIVRNLIAPGFPEAQKALTVELMRLDLIAILIFSISGLAMAGLQANQHFLLPALAPGLYNIGQIFGIAILAPEQGISLGSLQLPAFGLGIHGLVYGVILGAILHLGIQIPGLLRFGFRWTPAINLNNPGVRQVMSLLGPRIATMFFLQVFFIARDNLASRLGEGAVTALNYGWFIMQVPETLIGSAIAIAILPTLSEYFARRQMDQFRQTIHNAVRTLLALTIPTAALLSVALRPLVSNLFGFDAAGVELVVWATRAYLLGLMGHALLETAARSFYAQQDARTPLYVAALNAAVYIILAVLLSPVLGAPGIALANSLAFTIEALLLLFLLNRKMPGLLTLGRPLLRVCLASAMGAIITYGVMQLPFPELPLAIAALALGGLGALPFILSEVKLLIKL